MYFTWEELRTRTAVLYSTFSLELYNAPSNKHIIIKKAREKKKEKRKKRQLRKTYTARVGPLPLNQRSEVFVG